MFDFTNLREITKQMHEASLVYAKNFWQKIFNTLDFNKDFPVEDYTEFLYVDIPDEADPLELFKDICLKISYSYSGNIKIEIKWNKKDDSFDESYDSVLKEALVLNGFVMNRSHDNLYSCNINKI